MEKVEKETEPAVNSQSSQNEGIYAPKDYRQSILAYLTEYKVETYQYFPTITEKTFPCVYQTKRNMYKNRHTFVVETEPGDFKDIHKAKEIKRLFEVISRESKFFGITTKDRHTPNFLFKWYYCGGWVKPIKAYRAIVGHLGNNCEIVQILFVENSNYEQFCKDFYILHFHK